MIFSCGSGITACVLALGAAVVGNKNMSVYDGSWTEWGSLHHLPIEK
jgi:thiosulfate/3-mercaptopyruvate sulfurtransferase